MLKNVFGSVGRVQFANGVHMTQIKISAIITKMIVNVLKLMILIVHYVLPMQKIARKKVSLQNFQIFSENSHFQEIMGVVFDSRNHMIKTDFTACCLFWLS